MSNTKVSTQIGVRVPNAMHVALVALAKAERRSIGFIVKDFIDAGLAREAKRKPKARRSADSPRGKAPTKS
jgi:hypothetical protein